MRTSIVDQPVRADEDALNVRAYTEALAEFIQNAQAPLTIALQGEWGSGKTSMMNALRHQLVDADTAPFYGVWINTWQFSLLSDPGSAIVKILLGIIGQIADRPSSPKEKVQNVGKSLLRLVTNVANQVVAKQTGVDVKGAIEGWKADDLPHGGISEVEALKRELGDLITSSLMDSPKRGYLFFIDDLDRIDPPTAVEILELLKNIFDLENCIFVLAIDYGVVVKGLKPKFGEMTIANQREFRSFFDKIIQLPFQMPVGAYQIDDFLLGSLQKIGYLTAEDRRNGKLCEDLTDYALESVGNNPRSLKRLINTLSLIRLLILKTQTRIDDHTFEEWKDVAFALVCFQIQYPQIRTALESFPDFVKWDDKFAQALRLDALKPDEVEKLKGMEEFDEVWEQHLFRLCRKDAFLEARSLHISQSLNRIRRRIEDSKNEIGEIVSNLLNLSAVTDVKNEPVQQASQEIYMPDALRRLRNIALGMKWMPVVENDGNYYYGSVLADDVSAISWQKRLQTNLSVDFVRSSDGECLYRGTFCLETTMRFISSENQLLLKMWGECWGDSEKGIDLTDSNVQETIEKVEKMFAEVWQVFGVQGNIGHREKNFWFNVSIPLKSLDVLNDSDFINHFRHAIVRMMKAFYLLKPYCVVKL